MKTIDELLIEIKEDKTDNLSTTSFQFKRDLWDFFADFKDKSVVEFGTHKGQTTRILSFLFKQVYTINNNDNEPARELNSDRTNIEYINFDLYGIEQLIIEDNISTFLIDAGHEYYHVVSDINKAVEMYCTEDCYIVFDDYGCNVHKDGVRAAVDEAINRKIVSVVKGIGHTAGHNFGTAGKKGPDRILEDFEGLITKINWYE